MNEEIKQCMLCGKEAYLFHTNKHCTCLHCKDVDLYTLEEWNIANTKPSLDVNEVLQAIADVRSSLTDSLNTLNNLVKEISKPEPTNQVVRLYKYTVYTLDWIYINTIYSGNVDTRTPIEGDYYREGRQYFKYMGIHF